MELADPGGESPRRDRAHPIALGPAGTRSPRPWIARAVPSLGGREDGRGDGGVEGGEGKASDSRAGSGVQQGTGFGEASRGGVELGRRGVGLRVEREGLLGGREVATLGSSRLPKGGVRRLVWGSLGKAVPCERVGFG